jgi:hypothetical protein
MSPTVIESKEIIQSIIQVPDVKNKRPIGTAGDTLGGTRTGMPLRMSKANDTTGFRKSYESSLEGLS